MELLVLLDPETLWADVVSAGSIRSVPEGRRTRVLRPGEVYLGFSYDTWREHLGGGMEVPPARVFAPDAPAVEQPRTPIEIGAVLDGGFQLIRRGSLPLLALAAASQLPSLLIGAVYGSSARSAFAWWWIPLLFAWMGLVQAGLIALFSQVYHGAAPDLAGVARTVARRALPVVAATFLAWAGILLGMMILIVPGIFLMCRYFAVTAVVVLEDRGPWQALGRSSQLAEGYGWSILATFGILQVLSYLADFGLRGMQGSGGALAMAGSAVELVVGVFMTALTSAVATAFYYALRVSREAYDVELLAQAAGQPAVA